MIRILQLLREEVRLEANQRLMMKKCIRIPNPISSWSNKDALAKMQLGSWEYDIATPAYKCNMTDIMASLGLVQLDRYHNCYNVVRISWIAMIDSCRHSHSSISPWERCSLSHHATFTYMCREGASLERSQPSFRWQGRNHK